MCGIVFSPHSLNMYEEHIYTYTHITYVWRNIGCVADLFDRYESICNHFLSMTLLNNGSLTTV